MVEVSYHGVDDRAYVAVVDNGGSMKLLKRDSQQVNLSDVSRNVSGK